MITKHEYASGLSTAFVENSFNNIQVAYEAFKHYGIDLDKEIPDENGNILCVDCENCHNCINCDACVNCDGCWCLLDERDVKNHFSYINDVKHMRNEPLTEKDKKDLQKCLDFTNYYLDIK